MGSRVDKERKSVDYVSIIFRVIAIVDYTYSVARVFLYYSYISYRAPLLSSPSGLCEV